MLGGCGISPSPPAAVAPGGSDSPSALAGNDLGVCLVYAFSVISCFNLRVCAKRPFSSACRVTFCGGREQTQHALLFSVREEVQPSQRR